MTQTEPAETSIRQLLKAASAQLAPDTDSPDLDAEILLMAVLEKPRSFLHAWPEKTLARQEESKFLQLVERRLNGEPVAHITGEKEFWSQPLSITADVLIPRPDTELLVEKTLEIIPPSAEFAIADLGTGSGAIAIALATERPGCKITATDNSAEALLIAKQNCQALNVNNVRCLKSDWCELLEHKDYDIIVSNPPYIAENDPHLHQGDLPWEPRSALTSGTDGLDDIKIISHQARSYLKPGGSLILEHGYNQKEQVQKLLEDLGYVDVQCHHDLAGLPRVTCATCSQSIEK